MTAIMQFIHIEIHQFYYRKMEEYKNGKDKKRITHNEYVHGFC